MTQIQAYLHVSGNCRQAMTLYQGCFGSELQLQTVGELPLAMQMIAGQRVQNQLVPPASGGQGTHPLKNTF